MTKKIGAEIIREYLKNMPSSAGVYRMIDAENNVLYVGKAKNLKNRVSNYVSDAGLSTRIMKMISLTASMEIVTTNTEAEAFLLEANLIKKLKPRYNILLRDDKTFPYIMLTNEEFPQITKHRGAKDKNNEYFGPFASAGAVNETIAILQKAFLLRPCSENIFKNRQRPCLQYQIKRCSAPCVNYISKKEYGDLVEQAKNFLKGKSREIQEKLAEEMQAESSATNYEKAAVLRDRITALTKVQHEQNIIATSLQDADIIALYREGDRSCVQVFFFRGGQNFGNKSYFPSHSIDASDAEVLSAFIAQFYVQQIPPRQLIISHELPDKELLEEALSIELGSKVELHHPLRGEKLVVLERAILNAKEALLRNLAQHASNLKMLEMVKDIFAMSETPKRVEVYDNSHISGTHAVGAMICAGKEGFEKKHYRRFNIRNTEISAGDDYGMLREVLTRRFTRAGKEGIFPDLVLIDGGAQQLAVATQVFAELGVNIAYAAIAKGVDRNAGREWFFLPDKLAFQLEKNNPVLHYLQRLRDEAHRFAIGSHRIKRSNAIRESALDQIPDIGAHRKRELLKHFGSSKGVESATLSELAQVNGISKKLAETIYNHFHEE